MNAQPERNSTVIFIIPGPNPRQHGLIFRLINLVLYLAQARLPSRASQLVTTPGYGFPANPTEIIKYLPLRYRSIKPMDKKVQLQAHFLLVQPTTERGIESYLLILCGGKANKVRSGSCFCLLPVCVSVSHLSICIWTRSLPGDMIECMGGSYAA